MMKNLPSSSVGSSFNHLFDCSAVMHYLCHLYHRALLIRLPFLWMFSDNYSSKFGGSELAWEIYFLSSRGSPRIFKGSHQVPWISILSEDENPNFSRPAMLFVACDVIQLFCTSPPKSEQATKTLIEPFPAIYGTFAHTFLMLTSLWCTDQSLVYCSNVRSKCIQLKPCSSQWCTGRKFGAYGIHVAHQRCTFVRSN